MLRIDQLTKRYGPVVANDGVTFDVAPGSIVGFVGPNGSGKSTTMRSVMGLVAPDAGTIVWRDHPVDLGARRRFGYLPEQRGLYPKMKIAEQVVFFAQLKGIDRDQARRQAGELLDDLGLGDRLNDPLEKLSHGNQQRVQLAVALVGQPELLLLDEPFNGLDPVAAEALSQTLVARVQQGAAVLFSSHQLDAVERICHGIVVVAQGRIRAAGTIDAVRRSGGPNRARIRVDRPLTPLADQFTDLAITAHSASSITVAVTCERDLDAVLARARRAGPLLEVRYEPPALDERFAELVAVTPADADPAPHTSAEPQLPGDDR
jgi:ABC-2 type transport system ATP-binding protein